MNWQLTFVEAENLRALRRARLDLGYQACLLLGYNGAGKSALQNGIRMTLWGRCEYTQRNGAGGAEYLVGDDGEEARVTLGILRQDGEACTVRWSIDRSGATTLDVVDTQDKPKFRGQQKDLRRLLAQWLGVNWQHAEVGADPAAYLSGGELTGLLAELAAGEITPERLKQAAGARTDGLLRLAESSGVTLRTAQDLAKLGKLAVDERKPVNAEVKRLQREIAELPEVAAPLAPDGTELTADVLPALDQQLRQAEADLEGLLVEKGQARNRLSGQALEAKKRELTELIIEYRKRRKADEATLAELQAKRDAAGDLDKALETEAKAERAKVRADAQVEHAQTEVKRIADLAGACPTCGQAVGKAVRDKLSAQPGKALAEAQHIAKQAKAAAEKAQAEAGRIRAAIVECSSQIPGLDARILDAQRQEADRESELAELELQDEGRTEAEIDEATEDLRARIADGRAKQEALHVLKRRADLGAKLDAALEQQEFLQWACDALDKGELAAALMRDGLGAFEASCNAALAPFGMEVAVSVQGRDAEVLLAPQSNGRKRPYRGLSKGERAVAQLTVATAYAAGGLAMVDDADGLDAQRKALLMEAMQAAPERLGTCLVAAAWGAGYADPESLASLAAAVAPVQVAWVVDGAVSVVAPAEVVEA